MYTDLQFVYFHCKYFYIHPISNANLPMSCFGECQARYKDQIKAPWSQGLFPILVQRRLLDVPLGHRQSIVFLPRFESNHIHVGRLAIISEKLPCLKPGSVWYKDLLHLLFSYTGLFLCFSFCIYLHTKILQTIL